MSPNTTPIAAIVSGSMPAFSLALPLELIIIFFPQCPRIALLRRSGVRERSSPSTDRTNDATRFRVVTRLWQQLFGYHRGKTGPAWRPAVVVAQHSIPGASHDQTGPSHPGCPPGNRYVLASHTHWQHCLPFRTDRTRSRHDAGGGGHRCTDPPRAPQFAGGRDGGGRKSR